MSLFKAIVGGVVGFATGGPAGAALGAAKGAGLLTRAKADSIVTKFSGIQGPGFKVGTGSSSIYTQQPQYDHAPMPTGQVQPQLMQMGAGCPVGYRLNKSTYVTRGGGTSRWPMQLLVHPKGSTCVRRRRRNVGNAKALRRSISRVKGFVKLARKAHSLVGGGRGRKSKTKLLQPGTSIVNVD